MPTGSASSRTDTKMCFRPEGLPFNPSPDRKSPQYVSMEQQRTVRSMRLEVPSVSTLTLEERVKPITALSISG